MFGQIVLVLPSSASTTSTWDTSGIKIGITSTTEMVCDSHLPSGFSDLVVQTERHFNAQRYERFGSLSLAALVITAMRSRVLVLHPRTRSLDPRTPDTGLMQKKNGSSRESGRKKLKTGSPLRTRADAPRRLTES